MSRAVVVLAEVRPGRESALATDLAALPQPSPLLRVAGTHLARLALLPALDGRPHLFLAATIDGDPPSYLEGLRAHAGAEIDTAFRHCPDYPGSGDPAEFGAWMARHRQEPGFWVRSYGHATVAEIQRALARHDRVRSLALRARDLDPAALQAAFREELAP